MRKKQILTIPNILSLIRLMLVPATMMLIFRAKMIAAFITFVFAELTDVIDGYIARRFCLISELGKWLDPMADKLMAVGVLLSFTIIKILPVWVVIVLAAKELLMLIGGLLMVKKGFIAPSNVLGKACAFLMNISIATGFFYFIDSWANIYPYVIYVGLAFSVFAMVQYSIRNFGLMFGPSEQAEIESSK